MTSQPRESGSYTRINLNSVHLVPAAAVWQAHKIIRSLCLTGVVGFGIVAMTASFALLVRQSPIFSERTRVYQDRYDICMATTTYMYNGFYDPAAHHNECVRTQKAYVAKKYPL